MVVEVCRRRREEADLWIGSRRHKQAGPGLPAEASSVEVSPPRYLGGYFSVTCTLDGFPRPRDTRAVSFERNGNLPRLLPHHYQGHAVVFWTITLEARARGWLNPAFHATFRELMLHAVARERLFCPAYCLMPDHLHLVWMGLRRDTDQRNAMKFLRTQLEPALGEGRQWQHQPHDHVLREKERQRNAFAKTCFYVLANPVRAGLVERERDWPFLGAVVPGYPTLHPMADDFWERFWGLYVRERDAEPPAPPVPPLAPPPP